MTIESPREKERGVEHGVGGGGGGGGRRGGGRKTTLLHIRGANGDIVDKARGTPTATAPTGDGSPQPA